MKITHYSREILRRHMSCYKTLTYPRHEIHVTTKDDTKHKFEYEVTNGKPSYLDFKLTIALQTSIRLMINDKTKDSIEINLQNCNIVVMRIK